MSNGDGRKFNRLHLPVRIDHGVDLVPHLAGPRRIVPLPLNPALDKRIDEKRQLKRQSQSLLLMALKARGQQVQKLLDGSARLIDVIAPVDEIGRCANSAPLRIPFGPQVVFDGVGKGDERADRAFDILLLGGRQRVAVRV